MKTAKGTRKPITILTLFGVREISEHDQILRTLESGKDIDIVDSGGRTLLMEAVIRQDHWLVEALINVGRRFILPLNHHTLGASI